MSGWLQQWLGEERSQQTQALTRREESELLLLVGFTITLESCGTAERCGAVRLMAEGLSSALEGLSVLECSEITNWRGWESARRRQGVRHRRGESRRAQGQPFACEEKDE